MIPKHFKASSLLFSFITSEEINPEPVLDHVEHPLCSLGCLSCVLLGWTNVLHAAGPFQGLQRCHLQAPGQHVLMRCLRNTRRNTVKHPPWKGLPTSVCPREDPLGKPGKNSPIPCLCLAPLGHAQVAPGTTHTQLGPVSPVGPAAAPVQNLPKEDKHLYVLFFFFLLLKISPTVGHSGLP